MLKKPKSLMEKEIFEQPQVLDEIVQKYCTRGKILIDFPRNFEKIKFIASGSSYNCARLAEKFFRDIAQIDAASEFSSEFLANKNLKINKDTLYFFISQSGETSDTLAVLNLVRRAGGKTFVMTNNENSTMQKLSKQGVCVSAGDENAIAATKSFSSCVLWRIFVRS
jgi:glucosamine--fructose-6-phosphate aminotransferase (isomerizing)